MRHRSPNKQSLKDLAEFLGYRITSDPLDADIYISVDYNTENEPVLRERKEAEKVNVLFRSEPSCVLPTGYSKTAMELNDQIITFGRPQTQPNSEYWPQFWNENLSTQGISERIQDRAALINANKLNLTPHELYSLRRLCIKKLKNVDSFGDEWNSSMGSRIKVAVIEILKNPSRHLFTYFFHSRYWLTRWPKTLAPVEKSDSLKQYKVSLVIENEITYLSEKLFDALTSGCIPVYVGPDISGYGIPKSLVIEAKANVKSIQTALEQARQADYEKFRERLREWFIQPETIERHKGEIVMARVLEKCVTNFNNYRN